MPRNVQLYHAIEQLRSSNNVGLQEKCDALDAILKVHPDNIDNFTQAIEDKEAVWGYFANVMTPLDSGYLSKESRFVSTYQNVTLKSIQHKAAEERIKLGLDNKTLEGKEVLLHILKYNTEECRAYLAGKVKVLNEIPGWQESKLPNPDKPLVNESKESITDDAIQNIRTEAAKLYLTELIAQAPAAKRQVLDELLNVATPQTFSEKAIALGFPSDDQSKEALNNLYRVPNVVRWLNTEVEPRINAIKSDAAVTTFHDKVQALSDDWLLEHADLIATADNTEFINRLINELPEQDTYRDLANNAKEELGKKVKQQLSERYLQAKLAQGDAAIQLPVVILAQTEQEMKAALSASQSLNQDIINNAVTKDNLDVFKLAFLKNVPRLLTDQQVPAFQKARDLKEFKDLLLAKMKREGHANATLEQLDFIKDEHLNQLKSDLRLRHFEQLVREASPLGEAAVHSELIKVFKSLPPEKQSHLLQHKENLTFILNSQSKSVIRHYLGSDDAQVDELVAENKRLDLFRQIHNAEIALVLARFNPPIILDKDIVNNINRIIFDFSDAVTSDPATNQQYIDLIERIRGQCSIDNVNQDAFAKAFGIDSNAVTANNRTATNVRKQHVLNKPFQDSRDAAQTETGKKLYDILLRVQKSDEFLAFFNGLPDLQNVRPEQQLTEKVKETLSQSFLTATSYDDFFNQLSSSLNIQNNVEKQKLKSTLSRELTPLVYKELKRDFLNRSFVGEPLETNSDKTVRAAYLQGSRLALESFQRDNKKLLKEDERVQSIRDIDEQHPYQPDLGGKSKVQISALRRNYQTIDERYRDSIDYLTEKQKEFEARKVALLPIDEENNVADQVRFRRDLNTKAGKLNDDLDQEIEKIKKQIKAYQEIRSKLAEQIMPVLDKAINDSERTVYMGEGTKVYITDRAKSRNMSESSSQNVLHERNPNRAPNTLLLANGADPQGLYKRIGKPASGEVICFDTKSTFNKEVVLPNGQKQTQSVDMTGRFTFDASPDGALSQSVQGSQVRIPVPGRLEIIQPPKPSNDKLNVAEELNAAKLEYYFEVVSVALANKADPPSAEHPIVLKGVAGKEDELKYLWTALVIMGERNPKMKFSPDAIEIIGTANFNPYDPAAPQRKKMFKKFGPDRGFADTSFYNSNFKKNESLINSFVQRGIKKITEEQEARVQSKKVDTSVQKLQSMKSGVREVRQKIEQETEAKRKGEGVSEESLAVNKKLGN